MFILQNGSLFVKKGDKLVGVDFYLDKVELKENVIAEEMPDRLALTYDEVVLKFNITNDNPYLCKEESEKTKGRSKGGK